MQLLLRHPPIYEASIRPDQRLGLTFLLSGNFIWTYVCDDPLQLVAVRLFYPYGQLVFHDVSSTQLSRRWKVAILLRLKRVRVCAFRKLANLRGGS
jgi:hypothetical protein